MRTVVSYDDITLPYEATTNINEEVAKLNRTESNPAKPPPSKKRKKSRAQNGFHTKTSSSAATPDEDSEEYLQVEESRELTHEEVWDDSALIEAWNAATEEYEAYNGPDKGWKDEPIHKSPLWYNFPATKKQKTSHDTSSTMKAPTSSAFNEDAYAHDVQDDENSQPVDFNTFVPSHNPGLDLPVLEEPPAIPGPDFSAFYSRSLAESGGPMVSQDEAFSRALGAMYWGGYWTAVYHVSINFVICSHHSYLSISAKGRCEARKGLSKKKKRNPLETWMKIWMRVMRTMRHTLTKLHPLETLCPLNGESETRMCASRTLHEL
ncbi:hypothetical protein K435DRAFT_696836 [Dendrothele bispora CBS 962.96]|uniref:Survival Motor Neuron Gemin2-binding domain-containing protein n=1 Tax=Dendrothele bispora (strain CBS 962.96) TaxID=1314807 RepID=A0A4S8KVR6_DENBC|nr:hypothetical protein K435DRAFT_696836 [Dendrothele bispora CBS 962.96]